MGHSSRRVVEPSSRQVVKSAVLVGQVFDCKSKRATPNKSLFVNKFVRSIPVWDMTLDKVLIEKCYVENLRTMTGLHC